MIVAEGLGVLNASRNVPSLTNAYYVYSRGWGDLTDIPIEQAYDRCASLSTDKILNRMTPVCE